MSEMQTTRRDFIAGICACIALCFAPWDRFTKWLGEMLAGVYEAPAYDWKDAAKHLQHVFSAELYKQWNRPSILLGMLDGAS